VGRVLAAIRSLIRDPSGKSGERASSNDCVDGRVRSQHTATLAYMAVPQRILPQDRNHREVDTREASRRMAGDWTLVEFRPARWLLVSLTILAVWLASPLLGKRALLALAWRFTPRRLRLLAGGVATLALVVLVGSIAALVLVLDQLA
jgi:hypothetical protein